MYVSFSVETKSFVEAYNTPISWNSNLFLVQSPRNLKFLKNFERIYLFFFLIFCLGTKGHPTFLPKKTDYLKNFMLSGAA